MRVRLLPSYPNDGPVYRQVRTVPIEMASIKGESGENDARSGRSFNYARHSEYRNAQIGYGGYGNRNEYREVFRQGFQTGYDEGYRDMRAMAIRPTGPVYVRTRRIGTRRAAGLRARSRSTAHRCIGRRRETSATAMAWNRRRAKPASKAFDPVRASRYRSGDHEYNSRYGSRDEYQREYRSAFQQGYQQGYGRR